MTWNEIQFYPYIARPYVAETVGPSRLPRVLAVLGLFVLLLGVAAVLWTDVRVTVSDGGETRMVRTYCRSVGQLLAAQGITLGERDVVVPGPAARLAEGMEIRILRAKQVRILVDGTEVRTVSRVETVGQALEACGVRLGAQDIVYPLPASRLQKDTVIKVTRVEVRTERTGVPVPFRVRRVTSPHLFVGLSQVVREGEPGLDLQEWKVTYHDGRAVEREPGQRVRVKDPRDKVVMVGMKDVSRGGSVPRYSAVITMRATAYTYTGYKCATGVDPAPGIVAVDPAVIPLGTELYVEGYGYARAMDTGGVIKGNRIDVFFTTREVALQWGVRDVNVYVLE
ncbi:ubiquitin-like domain-containing protein [Desulforudis sp. 1088]|uniref:ubiquitin-like domain-containing protein n=1 Tax=unclassified Candidatus Desulforudis TaxID=2635950 RepID=UPI00347DCD76